MIYVYLTPFLKLGNNYLSIKILYFTESSKGKYYIK